jgi:prephenate dehydratase
MSQKLKISINGVAGSYSDMARHHMIPQAQTMAAETFAEAFSMLADGRADLALIPIDNSLAGRVADVHHHLARSNFYIIGEWFLPIHHCLLGLRGARLNQITDIYSHVHALPQCRKLIAELKAREHIHYDTAGAAKDVAAWGDPSKAAIASALAAEIYGLDILRENVEDDDQNTTRFLLFAREEKKLSFDAGTDYITSFYFQVRNIPAALYKALGGFATNRVQMLKLESYIDHDFNAARFYAEIKGHADDRDVARALEELRFFASDIRLMGTYTAHPFRANIRNN